MPESNSSLVMLRCYRRVISFILWHLAGPGIAITRYWQQRGGCVRCLLQLVQHAQGSTSSPAVHSHGDYLSQPTEQPQTRL